MLKDHILLGLLWILFCFFHSLFASGKLKRKMEKGMKEHFKMYRIYYTLFAFATFGITIYFQITITSFLLFTRSIITYIVGGVLSLAGLIIMLICIKKYFLSLSGLRSLFVEDSKPVLMITGIHKYIRHPLYLGTFIFIWGLLVLLPYASLLIANIIITVYTLVGIIWEEQKLVAEFGEDYKKYQMQVPKLLPIKRKE